MLTTTPTPLFSGNQDASSMMAFLVKPDYIALHKICQVVNVQAASVHRHVLFRVTTGYIRYTGVTHGRLLQLA